MHELTWGLDVSTDKAKTAAVALDWSTPGEARVVDVRRPLHAADIAPLISKHRESNGTYATFSGQARRCSNSGRGSTRTNKVWSC